MVRYKEVLASNASISDATAPRVALFIGGTSGIGNATIKALVATGVSMRIYIVGRRQSEQRIRAFIAELSGPFSNADIVWIEGEVSLLAETKRICDLIKSKESRIDLLFLSTGYAPFGQRIETTEGIEVVQSLQYYTRMLFILLLLPLLNQAEAPRVVSVLAGGLEKTSIDLDDLDLRRSGNFGPVKVQMQNACMNTTTLEQLSNLHPHVTFIHSWPGWVNTGNVRRGLSPGSILAWIVWLLLEPLIAILGYSNESSGQMHLFQCTNAIFGGSGVSKVGKPAVNSYGKQANGLFLVNYKCECTPNQKVLPILREQAQEPVWEHTMTILGPYLSP